MKKLIGSLLVGAFLVFAAPKTHAATNARAVDKVVNSGVAATYYSTSLLAADTQTFTNDGRVMLHFKKSGAGNATVTIQAQATVQGLAVSNRSVSVPATTGDVFIGPFAPSIFNDANGVVSFSFSDTVGLSFAILHL